MKPKLFAFSTLMVLFLIINHTILFAQEDPTLFRLSVTQDLAGNIRGGIQSGLAQMGLIQLDLTLDTEEEDLWRNGTWKLQIQNTYGHQPTRQLVGDVQVFSNIEHGNYTYLYQFWYRHDFKRLSLLAGKHDMNSWFFTSNYAGRYINSSFGIMPVASLNVPVSIFPSTTLGVAGRYVLTPSFTFRGGLYNGFPGDITRTNFGLDLNISPSAGLFYIGELTWSHSWQELEGTCKLGGFYHSGRFPSVCNPDAFHQGSSGIYLMADQLLLNGDKESGRLGTFFQVGYSPDPCSLNDFYMAYGINFSGWGNASPGNNLGLALAHASTNQSLVASHPDTYRQCETAIELTYTHHLTDQLVLQPDIQYILNPGMKAHHTNCLVGLVRVNWSYN